MLQQSARWYPIVLLLSILQKRSFIGYVVTPGHLFAGFSQMWMTLDLISPSATSTWGLSPKLGSHWVTSWAALVLPCRAVGIPEVSWPPCSPCSKWPKRCETRRGKFSSAASEWLPWLGCRKGPGREGAGTGMGRPVSHLGLCWKPSQPFGKEVVFEQMPL